MAVSYTHLDVYKRQELIERLEVEKINNTKCLPYEMKIDDYFDNTVVNEENLPDVVIDIVNEYDDTNDMGITKIKNLKIIVNGK